MKKRIIETIDSNGVSRYHIQEKVFGLFWMDDEYRTSYTHYHRALEKATYKYDKETKIHNLDET